MQGLPSILFSDDSAVSFCAGPGGSSMSFNAAPPPSVPMAAPMAAFTSALGPPAMLPIGGSLLGQLPAQGRWGLQAQTAGLPPESSGLVAVRQPLPSIPAPMPFMPQTFQPHAIRHSVQHAQPPQPQPQPLQHQLQMQASLILDKESLDVLQQLVPLLQAQEQTPETSPDGPGHAEQSVEFTALEKQQEQEMLDSLEKGTLQVLLQRADEA
mmetsp:Transcript_88829/g.157413  ORF Transcript_88829/g.157413 Transcript_88829/m.157413 type:complete len:211 (-) Transcript_88829:249-881(-)